MIGKYIEIHTSDYQVYKTRMTLSEIENCLGDGFIKIHRGCLVSVKAIHTITDKINLSNGDDLEYTVRKKKSIIEQFYQKQKNYIDRTLRKRKQTFQDNGRKWNPLKGEKTLQKKAKPKRSDYHCYWKYRPKHI